MWGIHGLSIDFSLKKTEIENKMKINDVVYFYSN